MVEDVVPSLLAKIKSEFEGARLDSERLKVLGKKLADKKAGYLDANDYAIELGDILSEALRGSLSDQTLPDGKMYYNIAKRLLGETLGRNYELVSDYAGAVQKNLNQKAKIGIAVQVPELNQDRIDGLVNRLSSEESFDAVKWLVEDPIVNFSQSIVDDFIQKNAEFHRDAGLEATIERRSTGRCCDWCQSLVGFYLYGKEPANFYRRHQRCRCTIDYDPKNGKKQNSWSKKWHNKASSKREDLRQQGLDVKDNNRKEDIKEYKQIFEKLGSKYAPISVAQFQNLKYNDIEKYLELKDRLLWSDSKFPTEKSLDGHFKSHGDEFDSLTKEQYQKMAADLLSEPKSEVILGYETEDRRVRYDSARNIFALGNPNTGKIKTMFRPVKGKEYYYGEVRKDLED